MGMNLCGQDMCYVSCNTCGAETEKIRGNSETVKYAEEKGWWKNTSTGAWKCPLCKVGKEHDVRLDYVGLSGRARLTCYSNFCKGATLVVQPYMTQDIWDAKKKEYLGKHPCSHIPDEGWRG